ncbi:MAG TPA: RNA 2',3'-cyclic phosphodiesterase [Malonomonas sp.]
MPEAAQRLRSFIAITLKKELKLQISNLQQQLVHAAPELKPVKAENLHLTLHFLGGQTQDQLAKIASAMLSIGQKKKNFNATVKGVGFFPNQRRPTIVWLGIHPQSGLTELHGCLSEELKQIGIAPDPRPYRPHLTIGRFKRPPEKPAALCPFLSHECGSLSIDQLTLFSSRLTAGGAIHTPLQTVPLRGT